MSSRRGLVTSPAVGDPRHDLFEPADRRFGREERERRPAARAALRGRLDGAADIAFVRFAGGHFQVGDFDVLVERVAQGGVAVGKRSWSTSASRRPSVAAAVASSGQVSLIRRGLPVTGSFRVHVHAK